MTPYHIHHWVYDNKQYTVSNNQYFEWLPAYYNHVDLKIMEQHRLLDTFTLRKT